MHARQPLRERLLRRERDDLAEVRFHLRGRPRRAVTGERLADERLRALVEQAGGVAVFILQDLAAGRIGSALLHLGDLHRQRVGEAGVPARVGEPHGIIRRRAAQRFVQREPVNVGRRRLAPFLLVPAAAEDPFPRPRLLRRLADHPHDVVPVLRGGKLQIARRFADAREVRVRVDEPWRRERTLEVDHPGGRADVPLDLLAGSEGHDRIAAHGHRLHLGPRLVHRHDFAAADDEVGRPHRARRLPGGPRGEREHEGRRRRARAEYISQHHRSSSTAVRRGSRPMCRPRRADTQVRPCT